MGICVDTTPPPLLFAYPSELEYPANSGSRSADPGAERALARAGVALSSALAAASSSPRNASEDMITLPEYVCARQRFQYLVGGRGRGKENATERKHAPDRHRRLREQHVHPRYITPVRNLARTRTPSLETQKQRDAPLRSRNANTATGKFAAPVAATYPIPWTHRTLPTPQRLALLLLPPRCSSCTRRTARRVASRIRTSNIEAARMGGSVSVWGKREGRERGRGETDCRGRRRRGRWRPMR